MSYLCTAMLKLTPLIKKHTILNFSTCREVWLACFLSLSSLQPNQSIPLEEAIKAPLATESRNNSLPREEVAPKEPVRDNPCAGDSFLQPLLRYVILPVGLLSSFYLGYKAWRPTPEKHTFNSSPNTPSAHFNTPSYKRDSIKYKEVTSQEVKNSSVPTERRKNKTNVVPPTDAEKYQAYLEKIFLPKDKELLSTAVSMADYFFEDKARIDAINEFIGKAAKRSAKNTLESASLIAKFTRERAAKNFVFRSKRHKIVIKKQIQEVSQSESHSLNQISTLERFKKHCRIYHTMQKEKIKDLILPKVFYIEDYIIEETIEAHNPSFEANIELYTTQPTSFDNVVKELIILYEKHSMRLDDAFNAKKPDPFWSLLFKGDGSLQLPRYCNFSLGMKDNQGKCYLMDIEDIKFDKKSNYKEFTLFPFFGLHGPSIIGEGKYSDSSTWKAVTKPFTVIQQLSQKAKNKSLNKDTHSKKIEPATILKTVNKELENVSKDLKKVPTLDFSLKGCVNEKFLTRIQRLLNGYIEDRMEDIVDTLSELAGNRDHTKPLLILKSHLNLNDIAVYQQDIEDIMTIFQESNNNTLRGYAQKIQNSDYKNANFEEISLAKNQDLFQALKQMSQFMLFLNELVVRSILDHFTKEELILYWLEKEDLESAQRLFGSDDIPIHPFTLYKKYYYILI